MGIKKYLSLDKLDLFYEKLKAKMSSDNATTLASAKEYTNQELDDFAGEMNEAIDLIDTAIEGKANSVHTHTIAQVSNLQTELNAKETKGSAEAALTSAKSYTDTKVGTLSSEVTSSVKTLTDAVGSKADSVHTHSISQVNGLQAELNAKEAKGSAETALTSAKAYTDTEVASTLESANSYTDTKISGLINGAPTTLDTLGEIATAFAENKDVVDALDEAIGNKANATHNHVIGDVTDLQTTLDGLATKTDVTLAKGTVPATFGYDVVMDFVLNSSVEKFDYIASVSGGNYYFFRITDKVITKTELEQLKTKGSNMSFSVYGYGDFAFPITEIAVVDESEKIITFSEFAVCVTEDNVTSGTTVFPKAGIYSIGITGAMLVNSVAIDGLDLSMSETSKYFVETEATKKLDEKYIPDTVATKEYVDEKCSAASTQIVSYENIVTATSDNQKVFNIGIDTFDANTDKLDVYDGRLYLTKGRDYTVSGTTVTLTEGVYLGQSITFSVTKNIKALDNEVKINGSMLEESSVSLDKLTSLPTPSQIGAVPTSRKVNGKALTNDITLSASDVGARPSTWTPTASDIGVYTKAEVDNAIANVKVDVTSSVPMHLSVNSSGGLTITY